MFNITVSREISGTNFTWAANTVRLHLVQFHCHTHPNTGEFIPYFTHTRAITYTHVYCKEKTIKNVKSKIFRVALKSSDIRID